VMLFEFGQEIFDLRMMNVRVRIVELFPTLES
jgi:hypothetical protein